ncbi:MAG: hypothetical protein AAGG01_07220, partial [Planctomycetota bacterium]
MSRRPRFLGIHAATLDAEGRIQLPAALRDELHFKQPDFQLTVSLEGDGSLALRDREEWEAWTDALLSARAIPTQLDRRTLLTVAAHSSPVKCDKQGRIRVPDALLALLGLDRSHPGQREVFLVGAFHELRLWSRSQWETFADSSRGALGAGLDRLLQPRLQS